MSSIRIRCLYLNLISKILRPVVTNIAWPVCVRACVRACVCVCVCVCLLVITVSPTKTDEPIEVQFGLYTRMGPMNHELGGFQ